LGTIDQDVQALTVGTPPGQRLRRGTGRWIFNGSRLASIADIRPVVRAGYYTGVALGLLM
jgi:hypothetical protein